MEFERYGIARVTRARQQQAELTFLPDRTLCPAFCLPAWHPVLLSAYQYYGSVAAGWALGAIPPDRSSAIVALSWDWVGSTAYETEYATQGVCRFDGLEFSLEGRNSADETLFTVGGAGKIFDDRDFSSWRSASRNRAATAKRTALFQAAPANRLGSLSGALPFVSLPESSGDDFRVSALVGTDTGFYPQHPFHSGSGDHVNAAHLFDCALQAAHLFLGVPSGLICVGASAEFHRFVELDVPFELEVSGATDGLQNADKIALNFLVSQNGRNNATLGIKLINAPAVSWQHS